MTNLQRLVVSVLATMATVSGSANAQSPGAPRPTYSPYLNLTRPGNIANNYYGLVRPQVYAQNAIYGLQTQYGALSQSINNPQTTVGSQLTTGHQVTFMNYSHYYNMRGRQSVGGAAGPPPPPTTNATPAPSRRGGRSSPPSAARTNTGQ